MIATAARPYQQFESSSLRQPNKTISYFKLATGQKCGHFPAFLPT
ncbi:hypothetical protein [Bradyrhizobium sp. 186]|nr:hypothetical protein [Bradyrhizobium sp. 186]